MKIKRKVLVWCMRALIAIIILLVTGVIGFTVMQLHGKNSLYKKASQDAPSLEQGKQVELVTQENAGNDATWQEGDIRYNGEIYRYNEDMLTFLFMGIDNMEEVSITENHTLGGQSDALFLLCINPHNRQIQVIGINRDTMTEIAVYSEGGNFIGTTNAQITLQHAYGDGEKLSCERTRECVENLFYGIPIHGYCSINMGAIPLLNDAVGGVEVVALENLKTKKNTFTEGERVLLMGESAYDYLHYRDTNSFNSAGRRLERQKQYLTAYARQAASAMKTDITLPVTLYNTLSKYMVTDVSVDEVMYLASEFAGYELSKDNIYSLEGETVMGEKFEEFYVDEDALYDLIISVFYEKVEN